MTQLLEILEPNVSTEELHAVLEQLLSEHFNSDRRIVRIDRRPSQYHSSFPIEELDVEVDDGSVLHLIFKNLSDEALLEEARSTKPRLIRNPRREIEVYEHILSLEALGTAKFYGAVAAEKTQTYWLFIEEAPGLELYQIGELSAWQEAARWLARMHARFASRVSELESNPNLLNRDEKFYRTWMLRAEEFARFDWSPEQRLQVEKLVAGFDKAVERIMKFPRTFIHGEFFASHVLVDDGPDRWRVCPVDWEMAGTGPALIDLAALVSGRWTADEKESIASAYYSAMAGSETWQPTLAEFLNALDYCQLALAVQWLGWSRDWTPPIEHRHDWLSEAVQLADRLGLMNYRSV